MMYLYEQSYHVLVDVELKDLDQEFHEHCPKTN